MGFITLIKHSLGLYTRQDYLDAYNTGRQATAYDFLSKEHELYGLNGDDWCKNMYDFTMGYIDNLCGNDTIENDVELESDYDED